MATESGDRAKIWSKVRCRKLHEQKRDHHVYAVGLDTFRLDYYSATNMVDRLVEQFS
ncbi:hypothetical protein [Rhodococcus erythropolis]|uniref:hypothetical protein n=1 Tax=Rhodococcus erythropolis TaxID=1833 RepID=UPI001BEAC77E|nr:hypothetical protein [Rhodococcus erythropolis]MBT2268073.1 hypothetical protein [Rhodococcus erythropolis]